MSERQLYRTRVAFDILSEGPIPPHADAEDIAREADQGAYVMSNLTREEQRLTPKQMADALKEFGSSPGFFQLNDDGTESEDD